jgi:hypothetical protein
MGTLLEIVSILLTSMVKFALSPLLSLKLGYGLVETIIITGIGGCLGVTFFFLSSGWILEHIEGRRTRAVREGRRKAPRSFTRTNKMIVKVKRRQGLNGLAAITPVLISIPVGTIIAAKYFRHDPRALPVLFSSVLIWDIILSSIWNLAK